MKRLLFTLPLLAVIWVKPLNAEETQFQVVGRIYAPWNDAIYQEPMMQALSDAAQLRLDAAARLSAMLDELQATNPAMFNYLMQKYALTLQARAQ